MRLFSLAAKTAVTLVAAVFLVAAVVVGPPAFDAWTDVRTAERDGRVNARSWRDETPQAIGQALLAIETPPAHADHAVRSPPPTATLLASRLSAGRHATAFAGHVRRYLAAWLLASTYREDQLVDDYSRVAYFGREAYGIEAASRAWFGKPAAQLSVGEAAFLIGALSGPDHLEDAERAVARRNVVLMRMRECGFINAAQLATESAEPLRVVRR